MVVRDEIGYFVLYRKFVALGVIALLSMTALAACGSDDDSGDDIATDDSIEAPVVDDAAPEDEPEESDDAVATEPEDDPDEHDDVSVPDDFEGQVIEVTITDNEIDMDVDVNNVEGGELYIIGTNEGSSEHGMAVRFPEQENPTSERSLQPGESDVIHTFFEDPFIIYCPVNNHAEEHDMEIEIDPVI